MLEASVSVNLTFLGGDWSSALSLTPEPQPRRWLRRARASLSSRLRYSAICCLRFMARACARAGLGLKPIPLIPTPSSSSSSGSYMVISSSCHVNAALTGSTIRTSSSSESSKGRLDGRFIRNGGDPVLFLTLDLDSDNLLIEGYACCRLPAVCFCRRCCCGSCTCTLTQDSELGNGSFGGSTDFPSSSMTSFTSGGASASFMISSGL